jgi:tetratricopeptide (TPR) repeat protein
MIFGTSFRIGVLALACIVGSAYAADTSEQGELLTKEGTVEIGGPAPGWKPADPGLKLKVQDRLRTLALSRASVRLAELGRMRIDELTTLEILPPKAATSKATLDLKTGAIYFFTRERPREFILQTPYALAASRGTEFAAEVKADGRTIITVFDGEMEVTNARGGIVLGTGEQGSIQAGQAPVKTAVIETIKVVQWWLYYPGVLDVDELNFTPGERAVFSASITAYKAGDLKAALQFYPAGRTPQTEAERLYYAGLLLSVGQVDKADALLALVRPDSPQAIALRQIISVVSSSPMPPDPPTTFATESLAMSYVQQPTNLLAALQSARAAVAKSPTFGFAWERVGELEFSFGHTEAAKKALEESLRLSPKNAQALALRGFLLSAENHVAAAREAFEEAIHADGALGNAWLGRGLCRIRGGDDVGGLGDLETAAAVEPNRSLLRSYLGKAFDNVYNGHLAEKELALARRLDPYDPTPPLYSALLDERENRINEGVDSLEQSLDLNDNRRVYRSQLLLDEDRAVRSTSLATIYGSDGMDQVAEREAAKAVSADYGNYSAHLFLANSLDALRDPTLFNLRYETAWINELLLANLLAPVGAGALSQSITQQEYSKLFENNLPGFTSDTSYRSDGQFDQLASQFGTFGNTSYSIDGEDRHFSGVRPNNALDYFAGAVTLKQQLTPDDTVEVQTAVVDYHSGDNFQYYNPDVSVQTNYNARQEQTPTVILGYHHEWAPGVHTLFLGTRLSADQQFTDKDADYYLLVSGGKPGATSYLDTFPFNISYRNELTVYGAELNQIFQGEHSTLIFGGRFQSGTFGAQDQLIPTNSETQMIGLFDPANHSVQEGFERASGYGYYTAQLPDHLMLTGGVAYDTITYPLNFQNAPVSPGQGRRNDLEPKAALIWTPIPEVTLRGVYARSMGGVSIDESYRLEPVQLAGFTQAFRNVMPVIPAADVSAPSFNTFGAALDLKLSSRTYISVQAELIQSEADETFGLFETASGTNFPATSTTQRFNYTEQSLIATFNQLVGNELSFGAVYQVTRSRLETAFPGIPDPLSFYGAAPDPDVHAVLQQVTPYILVNHPSGVFVRLEAPWYSQSNSGYSTPLPGDEFYQVNLFVGYRLPRRYGAFMAGLQDINGRNYRLNPLTPYEELPRERVWSIRLQLAF